MFWDRVAWVYDLFANVLNRKANRRLCAVVEEQITPEDTVLECACGTGLLTGVIAKRCRKLTATDFSEKMLKRTRRKYGKWENVSLEQADLMQLRFPDACFDVVVAANVLHLLDDPNAALRELDRVCKPGGRLILPTYMSRTDAGDTNRMSAAIGKAGADFRHPFTSRSYRQFFADAGYSDVTYTLCEGKIPCVVAVVRKMGETAGDG